MGLLLCCLFYFTKSNFKSLLSQFPYQYLNLSMRIFNSRSFFSTQSPLRTLLEKEIIPQRKQKLLQIRKQHGEKVIGQVKVDDAVLGMRGLPVMFYDGSQLDPIDGITFRGHSIPDFCKKAQKAPRGEEPLPEAMFYLLLTGRYPNQTEFDEVSEEWKRRGQLTDAERNFILSLPTDFHPMTILSMAVLYLQRESKFFKAYQSGVNKSKYWETYYEDSMDLIAKLPHICATIYRHKYKNSELIDSNSQLDWAGNFAHMLGYESQGMKECLRGYLSIHADHEGGNVSAHACHLVGSALADPYLSYSAAMNGLAGPLHGLANQECLKWLVDLKEFHNGERPNRSKIQEFVNKTLKDGRVIPGYGHAVLRNTDPRFMHLKRFADKHIKDDYIADLARECFNTIPGILGQIGKIKNPYPNVDAFSGVCLQHYGLVENEFYTVVFAVSRAIGVLTNGVWARAFGLPIERPNSIDLIYMENLK